MSTDGNTVGIGDSIPRSSTRLCKKWSYWQFPLFIYILLLLWSLGSFRNTMLSKEHGPVAPKSTKRVLRGIWKVYGYKSQGEIRRQLYPAKSHHRRIKVTGSETAWSGRMWQSRDRVTTLVKMEGAIKVECRREHGSQLWTVLILNYITRAQDIQI